jgi:hypothetical protein
MPFFFAIVAVFLEPTNNAPYFRPRASKAGTGFAF